MAPEQVDNYGKVTTQADVWAFGMTALVRVLPHLQAGLPISTVSGTVHPRAPLP